MKNQKKAPTKKATAKKTVLAKASKPTTAQILDSIGIDAVCARIADCITLQVIATDAGVSKHMLIEWLAKYPDVYARAREAQADKMAEDILAIADEGKNDTYIDDDGEQRTNHDVIARSKLRVDARKWLAAKMAPRKYGEKLELSGDQNNPIAITRIERVIVGAT